MNGEARAETQKKEHKTCLPGEHPGGISLTKRLLKMGQCRIREQETGNAQISDAGLESPRALDLGAGDGTAVRFLRENGYDAEGIDLFPGSEEVREQDMRSLRCRDESYDLCLAECSLSSCGGRAEALREAHRILRPGGKFLLSDVFFQKRTDLEPLLGGDLTWEGWRKAFADAGFRICSMEDESILWKDFFLESLWKGNAEETLLDFFRSAGKAGCGYFLACLEKGEGNGTV